MKKTNKYKFVKGTDLIGKILFGIIHIIRKRPKIISVDGGKIPENSIFIGNHSGASGPMTYRTYLAPPYMMTWGAHQMCEGYRSRRRYLIDIFYGKKLGFGKVRAWVSGTLFAIVSKMIYKRAGIIPIYYDNRLKTTFELSLDALENGVSVLIFPEDSDVGYKEILEREFHPGYISFARLSAKHFGKEFPVNTFYYHKQKSVIILGKPHYISELSKTMNKQEINRYFRKYMMSLYYDYIQNDKYLQMKDINEQ